MRRAIFFLLVFSLLNAGSSNWKHMDVNAAQTNDSITVLESSASRLSIQVSLPELFLEEVEMMDGNIYTKASVRETGFLEVANPDVPVLGYWFLIPNGTEIAVEVQPGEPEVRDGIYLSPVQLPLTNLEDSPLFDFVKNEEIYATDANYPGVFYEIESDAVMRGQRIGLIWLYPYQHNPAAETLEIYNNLTVNLDFEGDIQPIPPRLRSETFKQMYRSMAINAEEVLAAENEAEDHHLPSSGPSGQYGWDYLIFTDPDFDQAANVLASWKQLKGYRTLVTKIPPKWGYVDIKKALLNAYKTWNIVPEYVLFIGDAENIPPDYRTDHEFNSTFYKGKDNSQGYIGTDLYYSTLESKGSHDPDDDLLPEVLFGRLSVDTKYQAMDRVEGIINYEKNPPSSSSFYDNVVMAAYFQDGGEHEVSSPSGSWSLIIEPDGIADRRFAQTTEDIGIFLSEPARGKTIKRMYYTESNVDPVKWNDNKQEYQAWNNWPGVKTSTGGTIPNDLKKSSGFGWDADSIDIEDAIEEGSFLVTHRDHGGRTRWSDPQFEITSVIFLENANKLPVVWSMNCETGWFDNETDFKNKNFEIDRTTNLEEGFSEYWERPPYRDIYDNDYGAVGVVAASRVSYGRYNERLFEGMVDAIWPDYLSNYGDSSPVYKMGVVHNLGKAYMNSKTSSGEEETQKIQQEEFHWFGDPSMEIRTEKPPMMLTSIASPWQWATHPKDFVIRVEWLDGEELSGPVVNAKVTISKPGLISDYWVGRTDEEGDVIFPGLVTSRLGEYNIVVTAPNAIPYGDVFESQAGPAGGIVLNSNVYSCSSEIEIRVADSHLVRQGNLEVSISTGGGDEEIINLRQIEEGSGMFLGGIATVSAEVEPGTQSFDGILQVFNGETITAHYFDQNDGEGNVVHMEDSAVIDCQPPRFGGLSNLTELGCYVKLEWEVTSELDGFTTYNIYRSEDSSFADSVRIGNTWALSHTDFTCGARKTYYYLVRAQDAAGNEDENLNILSARIFGIFLPVMNK